MKVADINDRRSEGGSEDEGLGSTTRDSGGSPIRVGRFEGDIGIALRARGTEGGKGKTLIARTKL